LKYEKRITKIDDEYFYEEKSKGNGLSLKMKLKRANLPHLSGLERKLQRQNSEEMEN